MICRITAVLSLALAATGVAAADQPKLIAGDQVDVCGDSITEQHLYSAFMEDYLLMCKPVADVKTVQFGWSGETSWGFFDKMDRLTLAYGGSVATTCYGMNDGGYRPLTDGTAKRYRENQTAIVRKFKKAGFRMVVLGSPGAVDADTFHGKPQDAVVYNKTLAGLADIDRQIAAEESVVFADVHQTMVDAMTKAKAKYGSGYVFAGPDGVHPGPNGHLVMAYAYLKAMGITGDIGTITVDLSAKSAAATAGHTVRGFTDSVVSITSDRYPFCFYGDPKSSDATAGVIEFVPFNQDLNRFMLVVNNPVADRVRVTFGPKSKEFSAADLAKGINLAAEFLDNPFVGPFTEVHKAVLIKQSVETGVDKNLYQPTATAKAKLPGTADAFDKLDAAARDVYVAQAKAVAGLVKPVDYTIKVEAVK